MATKPQPFQPSAADDTTHGVQVEQPETLMGDHAVAIASSTNTDAITDIIKAIGNEMNDAKAQLAVALLNVTAKAIKLQGRDEWTPRDFLSYGVALAALSHIDDSD